MLENAQMFFGTPVQDYRSARDWSGPEIAYRLRVDRNSPARQLIDLLDNFVANNDVVNVTALVLGEWGGEANASSLDLVRALVCHQERLAALTAIFFGDISHQERKISGIQNTDVSPLLSAFPRLEVLRVRGGQGLRFSQVGHAILRALIVETGGMPRQTLRELCRCEFPNLVHLELWLGARGHGWDGSIDDLFPILDAVRFPRLKYLGLRNSEIADDIARAVVQSPLIEKLNTLDLSLGNLSDAGGRSLWGLMWDLPLKQLNLSHHYLSLEMVRTLQNELRCKVVADQPKVECAGRRPVFVSE